MLPIEAIIFDAAGCLSDTPGESATVYDDVKPALAELKAMGIRLFVTSPLDAADLDRFLQQCRLAEYFEAAWNGVAQAAGPNPKQTIYLTATPEGLNTAKRAGIPAVLMMNDPDDAKRLALQKPAGGIVSLHELADFVRLVAAENAIGRRVRD